MSILQLVTITMYTFKYSNEYNEVPIVHEIVFLLHLNPIAEKTRGINFLMNQSILIIFLEKYCTRHKRIDALVTMLKPCSFYSNEFIF